MTAKNSLSAEKAFSRRQDNFPRELGRSSHPETHESSQAIISRLRQMADAARRNEERAKAQMQAFADQLEAAEERIEEMAAAMRQAEHRAREAEEWLERVLHEAQDIFKEQQRPLIRRVV